MAFSRWYPVSSFYYDPSIQPSKPIANLQAKDESQFRKVPKGRYDTTYRREYLNFANALPNQSSNSVDKYSQANSQNTQQPNEKANLNPYQVLPPISGQSNLQQTSIDHIITQSPNYANNAANQSDMYGQQQLASQQDTGPDTYLPIDPIYLSPQEEQALTNDVNREMGNYSTDQLKQFYSELTSYDPSLTGFTHHTYISLVAMRNNLPISEPLMRFLMSRYVSASQERGTVNYEELVKFLARCLGENMNRGSMQQQQQQPYQGYAPPQQYGMQQQQQQQPPYGMNMNNYNSRMLNSSRDQSTDAYDPDEQAILRLMHENMRDWDQVNLIDCDNLRKKFYEIDPYNRYILTQREIEDVIYKNRIPIQRSLIFQILEKYCKVATGQYRWPAFVDFLEKTYNLRLPNKKKTHYVLREDEQDKYSSEFSYRSTELDALRSKANEEDRLEEINRQIYNLQSLKQETKTRIESRLDDVVQGESWFTRFMRMANAMYSHRVNAGIDFVLPKDEARRLTTAYNTVYELNIPEQTIEDGLNKCTQKGNVLIDDLLKVLSKVK